MRESSRRVLPNRCTYCGEPIPLVGWLSHGTETGTEWFHISCWVERERVKPVPIWQRKGQGEGRLRRHPRSG